MTTAPSCYASAVPSVLGHARQRVGDIIPGAKRYPGVMARGTRWDRDDGRQARCKRAALGRAWFDSRDPHPIAFSSDAQRACCSCPLCVPPEPA
jgi:hypothetical protein